MKGPKQLTIADRLMSMHGSRVAVGEGQRIAACISKSNIWASTDPPIDSDSEAIAWRPRLWACEHRLCPVCAPRQRAKRQRIAIDAVLNSGPKGGDRSWKIITLTMPTMPYTDILIAMIIVNKAFSRLRNYESWCSWDVSGFRRVEFTVTHDGVHVHIHVLALCTYIPEEALVKEWRLALIAAGLADMGQPICYIELVQLDGKKETLRSGATLDKALIRECNYLTKLEPWDKLPDEALLIVAEAKTLPRVISRLGSRKDEKAHAKHENTYAHAGACALVHDTPLTDFSNGHKAARVATPTWREMLAELPVQDWWPHQETSIRRRQQQRRNALDSVEQYEMTVSDLFGPLLSIGPIDTISNDDILTQLFGPMSRLYSQLGPIE